MLVPGPAFLVVVSHDVLIVWIRVLSEVALDQVPRLFSRKPEHWKSYMLTVR
jgi:hypothetical protein